MPRNPPTKEVPMTRTPRSLTEQDAAVVWARAHNILDPTPLVPLLDTKIRVASQQKWEEMVGRVQYLAYLKRFFSSQFPTQIDFQMELACIRALPMAPFPPRPCVVGHRDGEPAITVLFQVGANEIRRIDIRLIPPPSACWGTGIFPGLDNLSQEVN